MNRRSVVMALVAMLLAPLPLLAQGGGMGQGQGRGGMAGMMTARLLVEQGSVEYLVTKSAEIELNADQTQQLTALGAAWAETTKESREKLRALLPQAGQGMGGDREAMMQRMQQMQPLAEQLREEDDRAVAEAMKLLQAEQQVKVKALLEERLENARPRRRSGDGS